MAPLTFRQLILILMAGSLLAAAGCGGSDPSPERAQRAVPPAVAGELAKKSDEVAAAVESGDECDAAHKADELLAKIEERANEMTAAVGEQARTVATDLTAELSCPPPPEPEEKKEKEKPDEELKPVPDQGGVGPGNGKGQGKGQGKGHKDESIRGED